MQRHRQSGGNLPGPSDVIRSIRKLTAVLRGEWRPEEHQDPNLGWWVLAVGGSLSDMDLPRRDQVREQLRINVAESGVVPGEYVWVWDETERAQLVLATLPSRVRAERLAERYRIKGIEVRVARAIGD